MNAFVSRVLLACLAATALTGGAHAIPFQITGGSATTSGVTVGSSVTATPSSGLSRSFDLQEGQSSGSFGFLDVAVSGVGVVAGQIQAQLYFSTPVSASASGVLAGFSIILGLASGGSLWVINDPGPISFGNGGLFDVDFYGFSVSCTRCTTLRGTVTASVSLLKAPASVLPPGSGLPPPASVPEPATLWLLGAGLLVIGLSARRRRIR